MVASFFIFINSMAYLHDCIPYGHDIFLTINMYFMCLVIFYNSVICDIMFVE